MDPYQIDSGEFAEKISVPRSKSHCNRALILASLKPEPVTIHFLSQSTDVLNMIRCLEEIGLEILNDGVNCTVKNSFPDCEGDQEEIILHTGDGGTTTRFLTALVALGKKRYRLIPELKMKERPMEELLACLEELGAEADRDDAGEIGIIGPIDPKPIEIDVERSTQFASALQMIFAPSGINLNCKNMKNSASYWKITEAMVHEYRLGKNEWDIPTDSSSAGYPLVMGAVNKSGMTLVDVKELDPDQADTEVVRILKETGCQFESTSEGLRIIPPDKLRPFEVDVSVCPDLAPTLAFLASVIEGESVFFNNKILKHKESNRLEEILSLLRNFLVPHRYDYLEDKLVISGSKNKIDKVRELVVAPDHRIVMVGSMFLRYHAGGTITCPEAIQKSFPNFFDLIP